MIRSTLLPVPVSASRIDDLKASKVFQDYEKAYKAASGMPLMIKVPTGNGASTPWAGENKFCELAARHNPACEECLKFQKTLEREASAKATTLKCFAGMCESAVPVRVGRDVVAFLMTGHVLLHHGNKKAFSPVARALLSFGSGIDLKKAEEAWLATRVLSPKQYQAFVAMLEVFARHLETIAGGLAPKQDKGSPHIRRVRGYIEEHPEKELSLASVAKLINLSAHYLCKKFKHETGMSFTDYVEHVRVEKAKSLLRDPARRVNEVCFDSGFRSLSQFNRAFKKQAGTSPTSFRREST